MNKKTLSFRENPLVIQEIERMIKGSIFWETPGEFIREAIREKLAWEVATCHFCLCEAHKTKQ